jgi:hypothetical protein
MHLQSHSPAGAHLPLELMVPPGEMPAEGPDFEAVTLRHLTTREQIESVMHLREEIDLSAHTSASSDFASLEKKETSWGSSTRSSSTAS